MCLAGEAVNIQVMNERNSRKGSLKKLVANNKELIVEYFFIQGMNHREISENLGIHETYVYRILKPYKDLAKELDYNILKP